MKSPYDDVILFRWDGASSSALKAYANRKGYTLSAYLRMLLDKFVASKCLLAQAPSSTHSEFHQNDKIANEHN